MGESLGGIVVFTLATLRANMWHDAHQAISYAMTQSRRNKKEDTHADYRGTATIGGVEYFMDAWINTADSGRKYMSVKFKSKQKIAPRQ